MKSRDLQWAETMVQEPRLEAVEFQRQAWRDCLAGKSTLIHSATVQVNAGGLAWPASSLESSSPPLVRLDSQATKSRRSATVGSLGHTAPRLGSRHLHITRRHAGEFRFALVA